jgi:hypothetical protein
MPLQNRVDPFGDIHAVPARGMFTGNRGIIHDPDTRTLLKRRWTTAAWLICECAFRGRTRQVMGRNAPSGNAGWTELFFLDEVTALAAGHRPCFYCRREKAREFADCFGKAFGVAKPRAGEIDARLHRERLASGGKADDIAHNDIGALPDGAMLSRGEQCYAKYGDSLRKWTWSGYTNIFRHHDFAQTGMKRLTPPATIAVLRAGYQPIWHPTAV